MGELEVTWSRVTSAWWLIVWRGFLGASVGGGLAGFLVGFSAALFGAQLETVKTAGSIAGAVWAIVWGVVVVRMALRKQYGEFRLALIPHSLIFDRAPPRI